MTVGLLVGAGLSSLAGYPLTNELLSVAGAYWKRRRDYSGFDQLHEREQAYIRIHGCFSRAISAADPNGVVDFEDLIDWIIKCQANGADWRNLSTNAERPAWSSLPIVELDVPGLDHDPNIVLHLTDALLFTALIRAEPDRIKVMRLGSKICREVKPDFIISTNYDCMFEYALREEFYPTCNIDYGVEHLVACSMQNRPNRVFQEYAVEAYERVLGQNALPIYKLHGSTNMVRCRNPDCSKIIVFPPVLHLPEDPHYVRNIEAWENSLLPDYNGRISYHCGTYDERQGVEERDCLQALVVTPQSGKEGLDSWKALMPVHEQALSRAGSCDRLIMIGSAFRPADQLLSPIVSAVKQIEFYGGAESYEAVKKVNPNCEFKGYWRADGLG